MTTQPHHSLCLCPICEAKSETNRLAWLDGPPTPVRSPSSSDRLWRQCVAEHPDALDGHVRCDRGLGHDGAHTATFTVVNAVEWADPSQSVVDELVDDLYQSDEIA